MPGLSGAADEARDRLVDTFVKNKKQTSQEQVIFWAFVSHMQVMSKPYASHIQVMS